MKNNNTNPRPVLSSKNQVHRTGLNTSAFTLVELIVVITILAILGTIAFISLQGYSKDTRNSVRLSDLSNINKMLGVKMVTAGKVPLPDNYVEITAGGIVLNYQGEAGERVLEQLGISNGGKDPKDETYYTYSTNTNLTKYQLLGFMEGDPIASVLDETFAVSDLSERQIRIYGNELGIVLDGTTNIPVTTTVDILNTTENYKTTFSEEILVEGTGAELFTYFYNRNKILLIDKELAKEDNSLVGYWDMETTTLSGTTTVLKDFSQYGNNGTGSGGVVIGGEDGKNGNATYFDGVDDLFKIFDNNSLKIQNISVSFISNSYGTGANSNLYPRIISKGGTSIVEEYGIWYNYAEDLYIGNRIEILNSSTNTYGNSSLFSNMENKWFHCTMTYDEIYIKYYINGVLSNINSTLGGPIVNSNSDLLIGNWEGLTRAFYGKIDDIRIYNRALSDDEIQTLYNSTK